MHVTAILLLGYHQEIESSLSGEETNRIEESLASSEILGASTVERTIHRFKAAGITSISVIGSPSLKRLKAKGVEYRVVESRERFLATVANSLQKYIRLGSDAILIAQLGAYAEVDVHAALEFHRSNQQSATPICAIDGPLGWWIVDTDQLSMANELVIPLGTFGEVLDGETAYVDRGYVNRLKSLSDVHQVAVDAFSGNCGIVPQGQEVRPGVWVHPEANVARGARLVAPMFVGKQTQIGPAVVLSGYSNIESHCRIGAETIVSETSILSYTIVGGNLDIRGCVIRGNELADLRRHATITVYDKTLLRSAASSPLGMRSPSADYISEYEHPTMRMLYPAWRASVQAFKGEI